MNFKTLFLSLVLFSHSQFTQAQEPIFNWATQTGLGGGWSQGVACDNQGSAYTTGDFTNAVSFTINGEETIFTPELNKDSYIAKSSGHGHFDWAIHASTEGSVVLKDCETDAEGNLFVVGHFNGDLSLSNDATISIPSNGLASGLVMKFNPDGILLWSQTFEVSSSIQLFKLQVDAMGSILMTGHFLGDLKVDPNDDTVILQSEGSATNALLIKLNSDGEYIWAKNISANTNNTLATGLDTDSNGNIFVSGEFHNTLDFDPGAGEFLLTANGLRDVFIMKLSPEGDFMWAKSFGGNAHDETNASLVDANDDVYLTGWFNETMEVATTNDTMQLTSNGSQDLFVIKVSSAGSVLWMRSIGGNSNFNEYGYDLETLDDNSLIISGIINGEIDLDPTDGVDLVQAQQSDVCLINLSQDGEYNWGQLFGGTAFEYYPTLDTDDTDAIYLHFRFAYDADVDPSENEVLFESPFSSAAMVKLIQAPNALEEIANTLESTLYPNPVMSVSTLGFANQKALSYQLSVFDSRGQVVLLRNTTKSSISIEKDDFAIGLYTYSLISENGQVGTGKFVVE